MQSLRCRISSHPSRRVKWPSKCAALKCDPAAKPSSLWRTKERCVRATVPLPGFSVECILVAYQTIEKVEARNERSNKRHQGKGENSAESVLHLTRTSSATAGGASFAKEFSIEVI